MELRRDLLGISKPSRLRIFLGIGFLILSGLWIIVRVYENRNIGLIGWGYSALFLLYGIIYTIEGYGVSFQGLFGKSFISIDQDAIRIKTGIFDKEQNIPWNDIRSIDYHPLSFQVTRFNKTGETIKLSGIDYAMIQEIKMVIGSIAKEKGVGISI